MNVRSAIFASVVFCACSRQPQGASPWLTAPSRDQHDRFFPIAAGSHAVDCNSCHGGAESFSTFTCTTCHTQAATDPLHTQESGYVWRSASCFACHPRGTGTLTPAAHARYFPIDSSATHALGSPAVVMAGSIQCSSCHIEPAAGARSFDCTRCHTQAQMIESGVSFHRSVPDCRWPNPPDPQASSLACLHCHADGRTPVSVSFSTTAPPHDATFRFRIAPGTVHGGQECLACHSVSAPKNGTGVMVTDFTQQTCTTCHLLTGTLKQDLAAIHASVAGFTPVPAAPAPAYSKTCLTCHADGQINGALAAQNHAAFPIGAADSHAYGKAVVVAGAARSITCAACHVDAASRPDVECTSCHIQQGNGTPSASVPADQTVAHSGIVSATPVNLWLGTGPVGAGAGASASCLRCHAGDAQRKGFAAKHGLAGPAGAVFEIGAGSNHFVSCDQCHTAAATSPGLQNPHFDFARASCDKCHAPAATIATHQSFGSPIPAAYVAGDLNNASSCLACHPNGGTAAGFKHASFPIAATDVHNSSVAKCSECHTTPASYSGSPAANLGLIDCLGCHSDAKAVHSAPKAGRTIWDVPGGASYASNALCLKCHAGNVGGAVASFSTPLVFRLAPHDLHCRADKPIGAASSHQVDRNADNGVNICFACHNALATGSATPWATDWTVASPTASCIACHEHQLNPAPAVTCR